MVVNSTPIKIAINVSRKVIEKLDSSQNRSTRKPTPKKIQEKEYLFFNFDLQGMFDDFYKTKLIEITEMKCLEETDQVNDVTPHFLQ